MKKPKLLTDEQISSKLDENDKKFQVLQSRFNELLKRNKESDKLIQRMAKKMDEQTSYINHLEKKIEAVKNDPSILRRRRH